MDGVCPKALLASHLAAEHIRYHEQPSFFEPQCWARWAVHSEASLDVGRIGKRPETARAYREDRQQKAQFMWNSARGKHDRVEDQFKHSVYGKRNSAGKPRQMHVTHREQDHACGRFDDRGKRVNSLGVVAMGGQHTKLTLHGGGYTNVMESKHPEEGGTPAEVKTFNSIQKPYNDHVARLFSRNQSVPHSSRRERRNSEADVELKVWCMPSINSSEDNGGCAKWHMKGRPVPPEDPRNVTVNSRQVRDAVQGRQYGGQGPPSKTWSGMRCTPGAENPAARKAAVTECTRHFARNLHRDRYTPRPW